MKAYKWLLYVLIIPCLTCCECGAATHYVVPTNSAAAAPYTNWDTAGTNIVDVANTAMTSGAPRVIWVTNGAYFPTNVIAVTNVVTLQSVNGRDVTILDGRDNTNRLLSFSSSSVDGFTIRNNTYTGSGAGVYGISLTLINCLLTGNHATDRGGGCYVLGAVTITNCIFRANSATNYGGAIFGDSISLLTIAGCLFEGNEAVVNYGGAIYLSSANNVTITNCQIVNNIGGNRGGGLASLTTTNNIKVINCAISSNSLRAGASRYGGGLYVEKQVNIVNCTVTDNTTSNAATGRGGGINGGTARNCLVVRNSCSQQGGGYYGSGNIESSTIASNYAGAAGGGIYFSGGTGMNNIVYYNTAPSAANFTNTIGNTGLNYSCVFPAVDGTGSITNDPGLIDLNGGNYRLRPTSPCINTGTNQEWMTNSFDLDNRMRVRYETVDMGAYEVIYNGTFFGFR